MDARWEHFSHGADVGIRGFGATPELAFCQVALALTAAVTEVNLVEQRQLCEVVCDATTLDHLLYDWLDQLVYEMATRGMLFGRFDVSFAGGRLSARLWGEAVDHARHQPAVEVKGPTYTELSVMRISRKGAWRAQCVVDV